MLQIKELTVGLKTLHQFLNGYGFEFEDYSINKGSDGYFAFASYTNGHKKLSIDYRFSIGQVLYQYKDSIVSHPFYLD